MRERLSGKVMELGVVERNWTSFLEGSRCPYPLLDELLFVAMLGCQLLDFGLALRLEQGQICIQGCNNEHAMQLWKVVPWHPACEFDICVVDYWVRANSNCLAYVFHEDALQCAVGSSLSSMQC